MLNWANLQRVNPIMAIPLREWWSLRRTNLSKADKAKFNSLVLLVIWSAWRETNARIFDKVSKPINVLIDHIKAEAKQWSLASLGRLSLTQA